MSTTRRLQEFLLHEGGVEQPHKKRTALAVAFLCGVIDELTVRVAAVSASRDRSAVVERLCKDFEAMRANMRDFRKEMVELKANLNLGHIRFGMPHRIQANASDLPSDRNIEDRVARLEEVISTNRARGAIY